MFIHNFEKLRARGESIEVKLPRRKLKLDPRANNPHYCKFDCQYHDDGITVTLTRLDHDNFNEGDPFEMRVYDPEIETVPKFDSTIYTYSGVTGEWAPADTTVGIIHPSVKNIKKNAFYRCIKMKKCILHNDVETIETCAFWFCLSLDALFLPSSLKTIERRAFYVCRNIRILGLALDNGIPEVGEEIIAGCINFFQVTNVQQYVYARSPCQLEISHKITNNDQVNRSILDFCRSIPPLHKVCLDTNVSAQSIQDCILMYDGSAIASFRDHDGMTPLHILAMNPHATTGSVLACLDADINAAFVKDSRGNTPLDYFWEKDSIESSIFIVAALCMHRNATVD